MLHTSLGNGCSTEKCSFVRSPALSFSRSRSHSRFVWRRIEVCRIKLHIHTVCARQNTEQPKPSKTSTVAVDEYRQKSRSVCNRARAFCDHLQTIELFLSAAWKIIQFQCTHYWYFHCCNQNRSTRTPLSLQQQQHHQHQHQHHQHQRQQRNRTIACGNGISKPNSYKTTQNNKKAATIQKNPNFKADNNVIACWGKSSRFKTFVHEEKTREEGKNEKTNSKCQSWGKILCFVEYLNGAQSINCRYLLFVFIEISSQNDGCALPQPTTIQSKLLNRLKFLLVLFKCSF